MATLLPERCRSGRESEGLEAIALRWDNDAEASGEERLKELAAHEEFIMTRAGITLAIEVEGKKTQPQFGLGLRRLLIRDANVGRSRWKSRCNWFLRQLCRSAGTAGMIGLL
jgi:hypothetical protein